MKKAGICTTVGFISVWLMAPQCLLSQTTPIVVQQDGYATLGPNTTLQEAEQRALEDALAKAVSEVAGVQIQSESYLSTSEDMVSGSRESRFVESFAAINRTASFGRVVRHKVLSNTIDEVRLSDEQKVRVVHLRVEAQVVKEVGQCDPSFHLALRLNKNLLLAADAPDENEELILTIESSKDGYLTLFGISGDTVRVLFPNEVLSENRIVSNAEFQFPSEMHRKAGLHLRALLPPGRMTQTEAVLALVTKVPIPFKGLGKTGGVRVLSTYQAAIGDLNTWLCNIPPDQRAEAHQIFEVRRRVQK